MTLSVHHTDSRTDEDVEYEVEWSRGKPCRGLRDRFGCPITPDEPGEIAVEVTDTRTGEVIDSLPSDLEDKILAAIENAGD